MIRGAYVDGYEPAEVIAEIAFQWVADVVVKAYDEDEGHNLATINVGEAIRREIETSVTPCGNSEFAGCDALRLHRIATQLRAYADLIEWTLNHATIRVEDHDHADLHE